MPSLTPIGGYYGRPTAMEKDGVKFDELKFDFSAMDEDTREKMTMTYGRDGALRQAVADRQHLVYAISDNTTAICDMMKSMANRENLARNRQVRAIMAQFPTHPNVVVLIDVSQLCSAGRLLLVTDDVEFVASSKDRALSRPVAEAPGPLIGWAGVVQSHTFTGQLYVSVDDAARMGQMIGSLRVSIH